MQKQKVYNLCQRVFAIVLGLVMLSMVFAGCADPQPQVSSDTLLQKAFKNYFPIGMTVQTGNLSRYDGAGLTRHFNSLTAEYQMKWARVQPEEGVFDWSASDTLVSYAKQNGKMVRGHALVWYKSIPAWIFSDLPQTPDDSARELLLTRIATHIETVVKRFDSTIYVWDVVNEAITNSPTAQEVETDAFFRRYRANAADGIDGTSGWDWYKYCGADYIFEAFRAADRARASAGLTDLKLFYNDYGLMFTNKRNAVVRLVEMMREQDVPIDGIGMQAHFKYDTFDAVEFEKSIQAFTELGLEVQLTELDISLYKSSEAGKLTLTEEEFRERSEIQAEAFEDIFRIARKYAEPQSVGGGRVTGVTFWGVADDSSWLNTSYANGKRTDYGLLFDRQYQPKPAFDRIVAFAEDASQE